MSDKKEVTDKIKSTISNLLPGEKIQFLEWITKQKAKNKVEDRLVVLTSYRVITFGKRKTSIKAKICRNGHLFDLKELTSFDDKKLKAVFKDFELEITSEKANEITETILKNYLKISLGIPEEHYLKFSCIPEGRLGPFDIETSQADGFLDAYNAWSNYYSTPPNSEFINFVQKEILSGNDEEKKRIFDLTGLKNLDKFAQEQNNSIAAIFAALRYNPFFNQLIVRNVAKRDIISLASMTISWNCNLTKITLSGTNTSEGFEKFGESLQQNKKLPLTHLDLSINKIPENKMESFTNGIRSMQTGLVYLDLSFCQLSGKSISMLFEALTKNHRHRTISYLNLSHNNFGKIGTEGFNKWMQSTQMESVLATLNLSNCSLDIGVAALSIAKNCSGLSLQFLNLSENRFEKRTYISVATMLKETKTLKELDLTRTKISSENCADILNEILSNKSIKNFSLKLGGNDIGFQGAKCLAKVIDSHPDSDSLDEIILDDNKFKAEGLALVSESLSKLVLLKKVSLSRNIVKAKNTVKILEPLSKLFQKANLQYLRIKGNDKNFLGPEIEKVFQNSTGRTNLIALDISGNHLGEKPLKALATMISQSNCQIQTLIFDENNTNIVSLQDFIWAFDSNPNLFDVRWPKNDFNRFKSSANKKESQNIKKDLKSMKKKFIEGNAKNNKGIQPISISIDYELILNNDWNTIHSIHIANDSVDERDNPNSPYSLIYDKSPKEVDLSESQGEDSQEQEKSKTD
ncbi:hypothetical protein M0811_03014 [Anaeramoeba ignava]|uniref:Uncharacterized protein n=1 Tax=Anaeramoeba ignava TaxID=1746090 RepID=A0A9Q0R522_ANAIG|nr:hypothetical protein M0811_02742 [Anaeramoeba ignava]KAJ5067824.1 hypothetical protein M0811_03014 [Anaeramoeba ignava]|eukprot:Anaeramoba_ignava/a789_72.p1 GENE.a789_72~~a789_72.p1  ORF type:complete len:747 (-),score=260.15 a789_72:159-2399(-)